MPLLGPAAMLLGFDIAPEAIDEHDDWHTHEHLPERLAIPGFRRGSRWVALQGGPRYMVLYEVERLATLTGSAYLARLNRPTPWTTKMMAHYRGMIRGLCTVAASTGTGLGPFGLLVRFGAAPGAEERLSAWLRRDILEALPLRPGLGSVHLLQAELAAPMTNEQRLRGADGGVDRALLVTGYRQDAVAALATAELDGRRLEAEGAAGATVALYRTDYALVADEVVPGHQVDRPDASDHEGEGSE
jgi:hypothetical protein